MAAEVTAESLGLYTADSVKADSFARVLLIGPPKAGKTACLARSAPKPLVLNCDGDSALRGAVHLGAKPLVCDVTSRASLTAGIKAAVKAVDAGLAQTVILDTLTLLGESIVDECSLTLDGYDLWREVRARLKGACKAILSLPCHVFITAHIAPDHDGTAGILPMIPGKAAIEIPALVDDWILLDVEAERKPHERLFLLGPQKKWTHSGRNVRRTCAVEASVPALFAELGIKL